MKQAGIKGLQLEGLLPGVTSATDFAPTSSFSS
jgi:hypothetical protein